jgi:chromosome segregation protein
MYLHSLELFGFKSFAPKTVLQFHRGVTCVVGPNGCGKSNVLDAIRWVLGEQSAKALRGGEMADVIFSGTDSRAALGMAEVSMNFAECEQQLGVDWNEVTITRRVFRDGSSEYLLNKTPCRLKDIHSLFMDTGIGRSAYSIMEQGKIDQILSSRPEDRRAIFEEAAGITRFKSQKKEALRKLEATEANLIRLDDIIKEVRRQIGSLQRQAGKARRYQTLLSELKIFETHSAQRQWENYDRQRVEGGEELASFQSRQSQLELEIEEGESSLSVQRSALTEMEDKLEVARRAAGDLRTRISNHENRIIFNREKVSEFEGLVARYQGEAVAGRERLQVAEAALRDADIELAKITELLAVELRHMEEKQAAAASLSGQRGDAESAMHRVGHEVQRLEHRVSAVRGQLAAVAQQREGAEARLGILQAELDQLGEAAARVESGLSDARDRVLENEESLARRAVELTEVEGNLRLSTMGLATVEGEIRQLERTLSEKASRLDVLRGLVESGEGFSAGTQAVLKGLDNSDFFKPAIEGALAQFIRVEPEYVAAVEAAFGAHLQAVVTGDSVKAGHILKTLRANKWGRAVLALRETGHTFDQDGHVDRVLPDGALGWLIDKVAVQPEAQAIVQRLLSFAVLVPDLETAMRLGPRKGWMWVTLSGDVLTRDGMLCGGLDSGDGSASMLERRNTIQSLENEVSALAAQIHERQTSRDEIAAQLKALQVQQEDAREARQSAQLSLSTLRGEIAQLERELSDTRRKQEGMGGEQSAAQARFQEALARVEVFESEVFELLSQIDQQQAQRAELQAQLEVCRAQEVEVVSELNELRVRVATERQRHSSLHHQRQPMESRLVELRDNLEQRERDIQDYEGRIATTLSETEEIHSNLEGLRGRVEESEAEVSKLLAERSSMAAQVEEEANELRTRRSALSGIHEQRSKLEVRVSQVSMKADALEEHIRRRYQMELREFQRDSYSLKVAYRDAMKRQRSGGSFSSNADSEEPAAATSAEGQGDDSGGDTMSVEAYELDWLRIEVMVREIDQRLEAMGPVNLEAIQEFEELEQRYAFLEKQQNDLMQSKEELLQVIAKINATTTQLFSETFEKVRVNFQEMFTELFGGGRANLLLSDEKDPLESGIEIIAKPPGKQLQSITLLSGGEKTMTAVALLFSIYMVKPSPFCVLDEMDAPLDESNINRFIKILDRFVGQSQFVVISHNKKTIARADALYGVTMEEHGVSRLVGVKFTRREDSPEKDSNVVGGGQLESVPSVAESFGKSPNLHSDDQSAGQELA